MNPNSLQSATIYIPHLKEWASITGACLENGKFQLLWKTDSKQEGTMDLDTAQELVKSFVAPF